MEATEDHPIELCPDLQMVESFLSWLNGGDEGCIELRVISPHGTFCGYFDDAHKAALATKGFNGKGQIYAGLNPRHKRFLDEPGKNQLLRRTRAAGDSDVVDRRFLLIDIDPIRPKDHSSTDKELQCAVDVAEKVCGMFDSKEVSAVLGLSGNGVHIIVRLDTKNMPDVYSSQNDPCRLFLRYLKQQFSTEFAEVDKTTYNPGQLVKVSGTHAIKGRNTPERPWRRAKIIGDLLSLSPTDIPGIFGSELGFQTPSLEARRAEVPPSEQFGGNLKKCRGDLRTLDLAALFDSKGMLLQKDTCDLSKAHVVCPFEASHSTSRASLSATSIFTNSDGFPGFHCFHSHCEGRGIGDLIEFFGPKEIDRFCTRNYTSEPGLSLRPWPTNCSMPPCLPSPRDFDLSHIPGVIADFCQDISERLQVPLCMPTVNLLVSLGTIVGRKVAIAPKQNDGWIVPAIMWGGCAVTPSQKKTPVANEALTPFNKVVESRSEQAMNDHSRIQAKREVLESQISAAKKQISSRKTSTDPDSVLGIESRISNLKRNLQELPRSCRRYKVTDSTVEQLLQILTGSPNGVLLYRDELSGLLSSFDKRGREGDREFYLECWNAKGDYTQDRCMRGWVPVKNPTVSVLGNIPPDKLEKLVLDRNGTANDGLLQRLQLMVCPDKRRDFCLIDRAPDESAISKICDLFFSLDRMDEHLDDAEPLVKRFDDAAQQLFNEWYECHERQLRSSEFDDSPLLESHLGKVPRTVCSLALLFSLVECFQDGVSYAQPVTAPQLRMAIEVCAVLETHARRIYSAEKALELRAARQIIRRIKEGYLIDGITVREICRKKWKELSDASIARSALKLLEGLGWIQVIELKNKIGAPSTIVKVNPNVQPEREQAPCPEGNDG